MERPPVWLCGRFELDLSRPIVMGILNVTPDSFSDGGSYGSPQDAVAAGLRMVDEGAQVVDVGGESTRPGAEPVSIDEELERVGPVVAELAACGVCVSVDTRHPTVAAGALRAGAAIINDVSGFRDPAMALVAAGSDAGLVVMHMLGEPSSMQSAPVYDDVVSDVTAYLRERVASLTSAGVARERIALDPGLGFGKTTAHNLELLRSTDRLVELGYPVLIGASRKRFIGEITGVAEPEARLAGSVVVALEVVRRGASIVRVHDVAATVQALDMYRAIEGEGSDR